MGYNLLIQCEIDFLFRHLLSPRRKTARKGESFPFHNQPEDFHLLTAQKQADGQRQRGSVERKHDRIELEGGWQVDSYLDTSGPEYAWMHTKNNPNLVSSSAV